MNHLHCLLIVRDTASLSSRLKHATRFANCRIEPLAVIDRESARLLAVDVFPRFGRQHGSRGVPTIARSNEHSIDLFSGEHLAKITHRFAFFGAVSGIDDLLPFVAARSLHIGDQTAANIGQLQHLGQYVAASPADTDDSEINPFARRSASVETECRGGNDGRHSQGERGFSCRGDKIASFEFR